MRDVRPSGAPPPLGSPTVRVKVASATPDPRPSGASIGPSSEPRIGSRRHASAGNTLAGDKISARAAGSTQTPPGARVNRCIVTNGGIYIHGTSPAEQVRLARLNDVLNERLLGEFPARPFPRILDVGCGLAQFTRAMAKGLAGGGRVIGVERDAAQIAEARRAADAAAEAHLVEIRQGDAVALPLSDDEWRGFDLAVARFLLEHVPDPAAVVASMVRAVRPGGLVVLVDDDHEALRLWPEAPAVLALWRAYIRSYDRNGNDPFVGRRLVSLLADAGARPSRATLVPFGGCAGEETFPALVKNLEEIFLGARPALVGPGLADPALVESAVEELHEWAGRPDACVWYSICWAQGEVGPARPE